MKLTKLNNTEYIISSPIYHHNKTMKIIIEKLFLFVNTTIEYLKKP